MRRFRPAVWAPLLGSLLLGLSPTAQAGPLATAERTVRPAEQRPAPETGSRLTAPRSPDAKVETVRHGGPSAALASGRTGAGVPVLAIGLASAPRVFPLGGAKPVHPPYLPTGPPNHS